MTVTRTPRLGLVRWDEDTDPWSREDHVESIDSLEARVARFDESTAAGRPAAALARRLHLATDTGALSLDTGAAWRGLATLDTVNVWTAKQRFDAGIDATDGVLEVTGGLALTGDLTVAGVSVATDTNLSDHVSAVGAHAASKITNTPAGNLAATDVQAALNELDTEKSAVGHGHAATAIANTPAGGIAAVTVQAAIDELDTEKAPKASPTFTGTTTTGTLAHGAGALVGFYGTAPVARPGTYNLTGGVDRTLGAYASDPESAAYTGAADGEAKLADLNALRAAYENLRTYVEDLAGIVVGTVTDLKTIGLVG